MLISHPMQCMYGDFPIERSHRRPLGLYKEVSRDYLVSIYIQAKLSCVRLRKRGTEQLWTRKMLQMWFMWSCSMCLSVSKHFAIFLLYLFHMLCCKSVQMYGLQLLALDPWNRGHGSRIQNHEIWYSMRRIAMEKSILDKYLIKLGIHVPKTVFYLGH